MLFYQPQKGYCYTSDSIILYDFISSFNIKGDVLEVGSGCGIIGLLVARDNPIFLSQIDIQKDFYLLTKKNAQINNICNEVIHGDFIKHKDSKRYDYIISNPPFYSSGDKSSKNYHISICKMESSLNMPDFFKQVKYFLKPQGRFIFCYKASSLSQIIQCLKEHKLTPENIRFVYSKDDKNARLVLIYTRLSSKAQTNILPPLLMYQQNELSKEMLDIYSKANTYTIKAQSFEFLS